MSLEQIQHDVFGSDRSDIPMIPYIDRRLSHELFSCTRIEWFALERTTKTHCWWLLLWCPPKQPRKQEHLKQASSSVLLRVVISLFRLVIFSSKALMILDTEVALWWHIQFHNLPTSMDLPPSHGGRQFSLENMLIAPYRYKSCRLWIFGWESRNQTSAR